MSATLSAEQNGSSPMSAAQIPLPPSTARSVREDEARPMYQSSSHHQTASPVDATGKAEEKNGPTLQESWEKLLSAVMEYDDVMVKNWKEDIDTLLVFTVLPERLQFTLDASSVRINCWWFLSLIFSLTSALFGLLCKQWLRAQQRDPPSRSPAEALALRQMRRDSFEKWGLSPFLSVLPILLEVTLLLFFVGILDLLWARRPIPFALCFVSVMLSAGLYFTTTFLPTLALLWKSDQLSYHLICPYKSPQAWAVYQLLVKALLALDDIPFINILDMGGEIDSLRME
ncbi:hypothetical protein WG66_000948 [Moniliophthora roreri]|nr:hypothetical protein WG66_000948 [Moniliophthora roreri]